MVTARCLVTDALDLIAVHAAEEPLSAHQEQQGLRTLNDVIAAASLERFLLYQTPALSLLWPQGTAYMTLGPGGNVAMLRPLQIGLQAERYEPLVQREYPLAIWSMAEYWELPDKALVADPLMLLAYDPQLPLGKLYGWPCPSTSVQVTIHPWQPLTTWPDFETDIALPPGYDLWLKAAVGAHLAPYYDKEVPQTVALMLQESKNNIKRVNVTIPKLAVPYFADPYTQQTSGDIHLGSTLY